MTIVATHSGSFHADDVFACAVLCIVYKDIKVLRSRNPEDWAKAEIVFDVGNGKHDHHMSVEKGKPFREDGKPYSSAGLIWRDFGVEAIRNVLGSEIPLEDADSIWTWIDRNIVLPIDLNDNGIEFTNDFEEISIISLVSSMNNHETDDGSDGHFMDAVAILRNFITSKIKSGLTIRNSEKAILNAFSLTDDPRYIVLDEFIPFKGAIEKNNLPVEFVVYNYASQNVWRIVCTNLAGEKFKNKKNLPASWGGLEGAELQEVSGVNDAVFCHPALFTCGAKSKEGIMLMLQKALD